MRSRSPRWIHPVQEKTLFSHWANVGVEGLHALVLVLVKRNTRVCCTPAATVNLSLVEPGVTVVRVAPFQITVYVRFVLVLFLNETWAVLFVAQADSGAVASVGSQPVVATVVPAEASRTKNSAVLLASRSTGRSLLEVAHR